MKVNGDTLVGNKSKKVKILETSIKSFSLKITLSSPLQQIKALKEFKFVINTEGDKMRYFHFKIVSFYFIEGYKLELYGHTHMANVLPDGSVELIPIVTINGKKSYDSSKKVISDDVTFTSTALVESDIESISITNCEQLKGMRDGVYTLDIGSLECALDEPIEGFSGDFNGNGNMLIISMNRPNSSACLFKKISKARISNLKVSGDLSGVNIVAPIACEAQLPIDLISVSTQTTLSLNVGGDENIIGGFLGKVLPNPNSQLEQRLNFRFSLAKNKFQLENADIEQPIYQGGYFGKSNGEIDNLQVNISSSFNLFQYPVHNSTFIYYFLHYVGNVIPSNSIDKRISSNFPLCLYYDKNQFLNYCVNYYSESLFIPDQLCGCDKSYYFYEYCLAFYGCRKNFFFFFFFFFLLTHSLLHP